jgi:hypothetical protein
MIAKYVEKFVRRGENREPQASALDAAFLAKHGYLKSME